MRTRAIRRSLGGLAALSLASVLALGLASPASAKSGYLGTWQGIYPTSKADDNVIAGTGSSCQLCHGNAGSFDTWNGYGWKLRELMGSMSLSAAIAACEPFDSDADPTGSDNLSEINADAQPGWTTGPNNTIYFKNGSTSTGNNPPAILGDLDPTSCTVSTYCTASTTSVAGCAAAINATGTPSLAAPAGFTVSSGPVPGKNLGLMYFSDKGALANPFGTQGGYICVKPGFRTPPRGSGGTVGSCDGDYSFTLADILAAGPGIGSVGNTINAAMWFRDPGNPDGFALSNGIEFTLCP